jgi:cell division protein FtsZ
MTISDAQKVAEEVHRRISPNARIIWGAGVDPALEHKIRVMVVMAGVRSNQILGKSQESAKLKGSDLDFIK